MNRISSDDAALLFSKWKEEDKPLILFISHSAAFGVSLAGARVDSFSPELLRLVTPPYGDLRIFLSGTVLSYVEQRELPQYPGTFKPPIFEECVRIEFAITGLQMLILAVPPMEEQRLFDEFK